MEPRDGRRRVWPDLGRDPHAGCTALMALTSAGTLLYVVTGEEISPELIKPRLVILNLARSSVLRSAAQPNGDDACGLVLDPNGLTAFESFCSAESFSDDVDLRVLNATTGEVKATVRTGADSA